MSNDNCTVVLMACRALSSVPLPPGLHSRALQANTTEACRALLGTDVNPYQATYRKGIAMHTHTQNPSIRRGLMSVRAETADPVATAVAGLNTAFKDFKAEHTKQLDALRSEVEDTNVKMAAAQMGAGRSGADNDRPFTDALDAKALRTSKEFRAHYGASQDPQANVTITDFVRGVAGMKTTEAAIKALSIGTDTAGGYTVPAITQGQILSALVPVSSLMRAGVGIVPMEEGAKSVTTAAISTLPTAAWRLEKGAIAESEPAFRAVVAAPQSLAFYFKISRELLADATNIEGALRIAISQAFAKELDRVGLRGTGTAPEPRGLLNTSGVTAVTNGANGAALTGYAGILSGMEAILNQNGPMPNAVIAAPRSVIKWGGLLDTTNQPIRKPELVQNLPIIATSQIPVNLTTGTSSDTTEIYMGNFANMYFLMRENVSIQLLREAFATTGEIGFMCHVRADVVVPYPQAFAVIKGVRA